MTALSTDLLEKATADFTTLREGAPLDMYRQYILARVKVSAWGCWIWPAAPTQRYGMAYVSLHHRPPDMNPESKNAKVRAHRLAFEVFVGPIPAGLELDHLCWMKKCVNPAHCEPVTSQENNERYMARWHPPPPPKAPRPPRRCPQGHVLDRGRLAPPFCRRDSDLPTACRGWVPRLSPSRNGPPAHAYNNRYEPAPPPPPEDEPVCRHYAKGAGQGCTHGSVHWFSTCVWRPLST